MLKTTFACCLLGLISLSAFAQNPREEIGKLIVEALKTENFDVLLPVIPDQSIISGIMDLEQSGDEKGEVGNITPEKATEMMLDKMRHEFEDMLSSAHLERVKLKKILYSKVIREESNPSSGIPMVAVEMEMTYKNKPIQLSFTTVEFEEKWYYVGTLRSVDLFGREKK